MHALDDFSLEVADGELVCILGPERLREDDAALGDVGSARPDARPGHPRRHAVITAPGRARSG